MTDKDKDRLRDTQPIASPTAADVLEVFVHFRTDLLDKIDERDRNVLLVIQQTVSGLLAENRRIMDAQQDQAKTLAAHARDIEDIRKKQNELASAITALDLKLDRKTKGLP